MIFPDKTKSYNNNSNCANSEIISLKEKRLCVAYVNHSLYGK